MKRLNRDGSVIFNALFGVVVLLIVGGALVMFHSNLADYYYEVKKDLSPAAVVVQKYITVTSTKRIVPPAISTKKQVAKPKTVAPAPAPTTFVPIQIQVAEPATPPPLKLQVKESVVLSGNITAEQIVAATNRQRAERGLTPLRANALLASAAVLKVEDMFLLQYFAHESPRTGEGAADLAGRVGYKYILIGENLALGNTFETAEDIVTGWMNSPGHRANILKSGYQEIGVVSKKAVYEGTEVWMAVQEFGTPQSACIAPDANLKKSLADLDDRMDGVSDELAARKAEVDQDNVSAYNALVDTFNQLVEEQKRDAAKYNDEVREYNGCLAGITG